MICTAAAVMSLIFFFFFVRFAQTNFFLSFCLICFFFFRVPSLTLQGLHLSFELSKLVYYYYYYFYIKAKLQIGNPKKKDKYIIF